MDFPEIPPVKIPFNLHALGKLADGTIRTLMLDVARAFEYSAMNPWFIKTVRKEGLNYPVLSRELTSITKIRAALNQIREFIMTKRRCHLYSDGIVITPLLLSIGAKKELK